MRDWDIRPNDGVGPLSFGMTQEEVAALIGPARLRRPMADGAVRESRHEPVDEFSHCYFREEKLYEVTFAPTTKNVTLNGILLFEEDPLEALKLLERLDGSAYADSGGVIFPSIAISTSGFVENDPTTMSVTVSEAGSWDFIRDEIPLISFI